jgi:putative transposase
MARQWRIGYEGALYHVLSRGNEGRPIFADDRDRVAFLDVLGSMCERFEVEVFSYVLMDTHYHLLLKTCRGNLSKCMQWFGVTYTRYYNVRHGRNGHLFQGRFKAFLVEDDPYLLQLSYYLHRNPLRAGTVNRLADYRWSSFPAYAYGRKGPAWLKTGLILSLFSGPDRFRAYRKEVQRYAGEKRKIWEQVRHGIVLGSKAFVDRIKDDYLKGKPHQEIPQQRAILRDKTAEDFLAEAGVEGRGGTKVDRDFGMCLLWESGRYTNQEIGEVFGITYSAVSRRVKMMRERMEEDKQLEKRYRHAKSRIKL